MQQTHPTVLSNSSLEDDLKLKILIRNSGKTQAQIADEIGVDRTYMSQLATGKVSWVNSSYFGALTKALGMTDEQIKAVKPSAVIESNTLIKKPTEVIILSREIPTKEMALESFRHYAYQMTGETRFGILTTTQFHENSLSVSGIINGEPHVVTTRYAPELTQAHPPQFYWTARDANSTLSVQNLRPIPTELAQMIEEKGHLAEELQTERWQQYLAGQRFSTGTASPERWWNLYLLLKNAGVEPGEN